MVYLLIVLTQNSFVVLLSQISTIVGSWIGPVSSNIVLEMRKKVRLETGITAFLNSCTMQGITMDDSYGMFVNGLDSNNQTVSQSAFLERERCMYDMRLLWLTKW